MALEMKDVALGKKYRRPGQHNARTVSRVGVSTVTLEGTQEHAVITLAEFLREYEEVDGDAPTPLVVRRAGVRVEAVAEGGPHGARMSRVLRLAALAMEDPEFPSAEAGETLLFFHRGDSTVASFSFRGEALAARAKRALEDAAPKVLGR